MTRPAVLMLLLSFALGCGKYGPPVRAGQARAEKPAPKLEVPLPLPSDPERPADESGAPPEPEQEPPPEGAP